MLDVDFRDVLAEFATHTSTRVPHPIRILDLPNDRPPGAVNSLPFGEKLGAEPLPIACLPVMAWHYHSKLLSRKSMGQAQKFVYLFAHIRAARVWGGQRMLSARFT